MIDSSNPYYAFNGMPAGCLPRASRPGEICPLASERVKIIPRPEWDTVAKQVQLKPFVREVLDQNPAGSCATESATGAVMLQRAFAGLDHVLLNPWFIYYHTGGQRDRGDGRSGGSSIDTNLAFIRENGIAPASIWPRSKGWRTKPSDEAYEAAKGFRIVEFYDVQTIDEMVSCILHGWPVVYGSNGHSVLKIAHIDENRGLDLNSWGKSWGDGGFGVWASYRAVDFRYGAWAIRTVVDS